MLSKRTSIFQPRKPASSISLDDLRLLEQRAYSGRPLLSAEELGSVLGGGYSNQPDWSANMPPSGDDTAKLLDTHLGGVLAGRGQDFVAAANKYGISPKLLAAISMFETGNGSSPMVRNKNNPAGIYDSRAGAYRTFDSLKQGLDFTARNLKVNYLDQGLDTPEKIGAKYAPVGASNDPNRTNAEWPAAVRANLASLGYMGPLVAGASSTSTEDQSPDLTGPLYIAPVDRSKLKTPTGRGELSNQDELDIARAKAEDYVQSLAKAGSTVTEKDYQEKFDAFYSEAHKLNMANALPGTRMIEPETPAAAGTPEAAAAAQTNVDLAKKIYAGQNLASSQDVADFARQNLNSYLTDLKKSGVTLNEKEYAQELQNYIAAAQKQNIGIQPERLPADQAEGLAAIAQGMDYNHTLLGLHKALPRTIPGQSPQLNPALATTDEYKAFDAQRNLALGITGRGLGNEKGPMAKDDLERVKKYVINEWDSDAQAQSKSLLIDTDSLQMMRSKIAYLKASHYDVANFEDLLNQKQAEYDARVNKLKEGAPSDVLRTTMDALQLNAVTQAHKDELKSLYKPTPAPTDTASQDKQVRPPIPMRPDYVAPSTDQSTQQEPSVTYPTITSDPGSPQAPAAIQTLVNAPGQIGQTIRRLLPTEAGPTEDLTQPPPMEAPNLRAWGQ